MLLRENPVHHAPVVHRVPHEDLDRVVDADDDDENGRAFGSVYVFDLSTLTPDLDGDEDVDVDDYTLFAACITGPGIRVRAVCESADLDCDEDVDLTDYTRFQSAFP
jgi:hypothetical protein